MFTKNMSNPAYGAARLGAERAAAWLDARVAHHVPRTPDDPREQSALLERALADAPDAIVIAVVHPTRVNAALDAARAARVPLFGFVNPVPGGSVSHVGASDGRLGADVARFVFEHLGGDGDVAIVAGPAQSVTSVERVPGYAAEPWYTVSAPRGVPVEIVRRLNADLDAALRSTDVIRSFDGLGVTALGGTPDDDARRNALETERWTRVIQAARIQPD